MTADEIRTTSTHTEELLNRFESASPEARASDDCAVFLREIAAQLAELNQTLRNRMPCLQKDAEAIHG